MAIGDLTLNTAYLHPTESGVAFQANPPPPHSIG